MTRPTARPWHKANDTATVRKPASSASRTFKDDLRVAGRWRQDAVRERKD